MTDTKKVDANVEDTEKSLGFFAANGRISPADAKEKAGLKAKKFVCPLCKREFAKTDVQFGEDVLCVCGGVMVTKI